MANSLSFADDSIKITAEEVNQHQSHIQTLAASCAACHGGLGNPVTNSPGEPKFFQLAGMDHAKFIAHMQAFKSGVRQSSVMHHHAKGLNEQEINDLAHFFSIQKMLTVKSIPTQQYDMNEQQ